LIVLDFETRSICDLKLCGASPYARHESTAVLCLAWSSPDGEIEFWKPEDPKPQSLFDLITAGEDLHAHNAAFERLIWEHVCVTKMGWPAVPFSQWRCTMAQCCRLALPRSLDAACKALDLPQKKDKGGSNLIRALCLPKQVLHQKNENDIWNNSPEKLQRLYDYCKQDVRAELALAYKIGELTPSELKVWQLDQRINDRGLKIDTESIADAGEVINQEAERCRKEVARVTNGAVSSATQRDQLLAWIREQGADIQNLTAPVVQEALDSEDLPADVREALQLRQKASKASTAKLKSMVNRMDEDGRVRGNLVYHGAGTGRWAGAGMQIQNFPRGSLSPEEIEVLLMVLSTKSGSAIDMLLGDPAASISSALRSMIIADPGNRLLVCDFAQIEARVLAWLANEHDLTAQFRAGDDVYVNLAAKIYDVDIDDVTKGQRFVGKTATLGLGYGMGHMSFQRTCWTLAKVAISNKFARHVVKLYRQTNRRVKQLWAELGSAAIRTMETSKAHRVGRVTMLREGDWFRIQLPSKRQLHYYNPEIILVTAPWSEGHVGTLFGEEADQEAIEEFDVTLGDRYEGGWIDCNFPKGSALKLRKAGYKMAVEQKEPEKIKQLTYMSVNGLTRKWERTKTYAGKLAENVTQAVARDFLVEAMLRVEGSGYPIVATIHDEILAELAIGKGSLVQFERIMRQIPTWGRGCPIDVEGFEAERYRK